MLFPLVRRVYENDPNYRRRRLQQQEQQHQQLDGMRRMLIA
jgi:hypothetical protein